MSLSKRCEYALRALACLAEAQMAGVPPLRVWEIAERQNLPASFLNQILLQLKEGGWVKTLRGKRGGTLLAKPAGEIGLGEIIRLVDGPLAPLSCVSKTAYARCSCPDEASCGLRRVMLQARDALLEVLEQRTVADLVAESGVAGGLPLADPVGLRPQRECRGAG
jgi:Rrf2 family protein